MATEQAFPPTGSVVPSSPGVIVSPFQFVADQDTFLRLTSVCSVVGVTVAMQGRRIDSHSALQTIQETHAPNSDRTVKFSDYLFGDGAIQNLTVFASAGAPLKGQCYVMVQILRNTGATAVVLGTLIAGYITAVQALGFPGSPIVSSTDGEPAVRNIVGTQPALGGSLHESAPTNARWELLTMLAQLSTNAAAGTRAALLSPQALGLGTMGVYFNNPAADQPPSTVYNYTFAPNVPVAFRNTFSDIAVPQRWLMGGGDGFIVSGQAVGDQWFAPQYTVREWLEVR